MCAKFEANQIIFRGGSRSLSSRLLDPPQCLSDNWVLSAHRRGYHACQALTVVQMLVGTLKMWETSYGVVIQHPEGTVVDLLLLYVGH